MEVAGSCEMLVPIHLTMWHHNPEGHDQNIHCFENVKSAMSINVQYLTVTLQQCFVVSGLLQCLLQQQAISSSSVKLCALLLSRRPVFIHDFMSLARQSKNLRQNAAVVLPLLSAAFKSKTPIEQNILNKMYSEYSAEIQAALLNPSKAADWLKLYSSVVVQLMHKCTGKLYINETLPVQAADSLN
jgi:hypothetical protein